VSELADMDLAYVEIVDDAYVYITPAQVTNRDRSARILNGLFDTYGITIDADVVSDRILLSQENRYVKIATDLNISLVDELQDKKELYREQRNELINKKREYNQLKAEQDTGVAVSIPDEYLAVANTEISPYPAMYAL